MSLSIHRLNRLDLVAKHIDEWTAFSNRHASVAPFCRAATWISWLEIYRENVPIVFELRDDSKLIALLPMYRKAMTLHPASEFHLDYQEIAAVSVDAAVELLKAIIAREGEKGLALGFGKVAEHSRLFAALNDPRISQVASIQSRYHSICPTVTYAINENRTLFDALLSRQRQDHRASKRRLDKEFPEHFIEHCDGTEIDSRRLNAIGELHRANQFRRSGPSIFVDPAFSQFIDRQVERGAPLTVSILWDREGGSPLAFDIGYFANNTYFYYMTAYETRQANLSPGRYLLVESLGHHAEKVEGESFRFDMLSGEEAYKSRWAKSYYEVSRIQVIPKRLVNLPRVAAFSAVYRLKSVKNQLRARLVGERQGKLEHEEIELAN